MLVTRWLKEQGVENLYSQNVVASYCKALPFQCFIGFVIICDNDPQDTKIGGISQGKCQDINTRRT